MTSVTRVGNFLIDTSRAPLVTVVYPPNPTEVEIRTVFHRYGQLCASGKPLGFVVDFRDFDPSLAPPSSGHLASQVWAEHADVMRASIVCEGRVVTNRVARSTLTSFDCFTTNKWPCAHFETLAEADRWVCQRLERSGALPVVKPLGTLERKDGIQTGCSLEPRVEPQLEPQLEPQSGRETGTVR